MSEKIDIAKIEISGPAIDAMDSRKESDNGPSEAQVTKEAAAYIKRFGPPKWSKELLRKVYEMGRAQS